MRSFRWLALTFVAVALSAVAAIAGPPWIAIEYPVNPFDPTTRDAFLVVRSYHHGAQVGLPVTGRAEGMVAGARRTIPLTFDTTSHAGVMALRKQWPSEGTWVLVINAAQAADDQVTALVELARDGSVRQVRVPTRRDGRWLLPQKVSAADVDAALGAAAARTN